MDEEQEKKKQKRTKQVLEVLVDGGHIVYGPISGNIILLDENGNKPYVPSVNIEIFLELREQNRIKETGSMQQGHHIFHGKVVFYVIA